MPSYQPKKHIFALQHNPTEKHTHKLADILDSKCRQTKELSLIAPPHHHHHHPHLLKLCLYPLPLPLLLLLLLLLLPPSPPPPFHLRPDTSDMGAKSRVLIIGATGYIGKHVARASVAEGHPTSILIRPSTLTTKAELVASFKDLGITFVEGSLDDHAGLVAAIKEVDVVISTVGGPAIPEQEKIIAAIKEAGNVLRFLPSEFGNDVDHAKALEPVNTMYGKKVAIRRKIEEAGIPYTYISSNAFAGYSLSNLVQFGKPSPPRDKVTIYGSGDAKAIFLKEEDIGLFTIKTIDDPRTLNKIVYLRPPGNILSVNEVVSLWESKIGAKLEREYVSEEDMIVLIKTSPIPKNIVLATVHNIFVRGDQYNFDIGENGVEASSLYPEVKYTTASEYLDKFV